MLQPVFGKETMQFYSAGFVLLVLAGHHNTSHKLPWTIDSNEQFIFAVGEDCIIRGWSLNEEGRLLCSLPAIPNPAIDNNADYPR